MKVILVDDEKELVSALSERLSFRGVEADWATNADDAMQLVRENSYDLAVLDVKMPKVSGLQLKEQLEEVAPDMKFIFLTGHGSSEDFKACCKEAGAKCYLVKPVKIEELMAKMQDVVAGC